MALSKPLKAWLKSGQAEIEAMLATGWKLTQFHVIPSRQLPFRQRLLAAGARFVRINLDGSLEAYVAPRHIEMLMKEAGFKEFDHMELP
jgi:hypothetical protein